MTRWILLLLFAFASPCLAQPSTGYAYATPDAPSNDGETGFSFLIDLADMPTEWWTAADDADGTKGRIYRSDGTRLACDWTIFSDSGTSGTGFVRFQDTMSASPSTYRVYPPVSGNSSVAADEGTYGSDDAYAAHIVGYWANGGNNDRTSNGNDGTTTGATAGAATGKIASATDYSNTAGGTANQYTNTGLLPGSSHKALMTWIKVDNMPGTSAFSTTGAHDLSDHRFYIGINVNAFIAAWGTGSQTDGSALSTATWYHLAMSETSGTVKGYVNGVEELSFAATFSGTSTAPVLLGARGQTASVFNSPFDGIQDETMASTSSLTQEWIVEEYRQTNDNTAYWSDGASSGWTWTAPGSGNPLLLQLQNGQ